MGALDAVLALTYSIWSLGEIFRDKRTMVKRPAKAHLFFPNMGCPSTEIDLRLIQAEPVSRVVIEGTRSHLVA